MTHADVPGRTSRSAAVEEAAALDAAGRHQDAISTLSRAAAGGDLAAKRVVGLRILIGDRAPRLGPQGASLILEAGAEGEPEAAALGAVLAGAGIHRPQSWSEALDWLLRAAELGHAGAQGQLRVLARAEIAAAAAQDWGRLRKAADPGALLAVPAPRVLSSDPRIVAFGGFVEPRVAAWLMQRARARLRQAEIYNPLASRDEVSEWRTNTTAVFPLAEADLVQIVLQARIARAASMPFAHLEALSVLHYAPGQAFDDHFDFVDPETPNYAEEIARNGQRRATFLVYLNEAYEGGETDFPRLGLAHRGASGEALMFLNALPDGAPDIRTLHAGRAPRSGEKWVVSQWLRSRPFAPGVAPAWRP